MNTKINTLVLWVTLLSNATHIRAMERPPQPQREKRTLEAPSEPEFKFHVKEWKPLDHQLIRLPEPQRLAQLQQIFVQAPAYTFWRQVLSSAANPATAHGGFFVKSDSPDGQTLSQNSELWHNLRELLVNQIIAASPQFKNQIAQVALANQGHLGVASLIAYFAYSLTYNPSVDLENLLKPIIRVLVANANLQQRFEAIYTIAKLGIMDPELMYQAFNILIEAGVNPNTPDQVTGLNIIQYIERRLIPLANQLPIDAMKNLFSRYPA